MRWPSRHRHNPEQLRSPLVAEGSPLSEEHCLDIAASPELWNTMSASRDSPLTSGSDGPDAVLIESGRSSSCRDSYGSSTPISRSQRAGDRSRCASPGVNGGAAGSSKYGGITQKTQIRVTKRPAGPAWRLKYHDFLPPSGDQHANDPEMHFKAIVDRANEWLAKNLDLTVKECETITWMDHDVTRLDDSEQMILRKRMAEDAKTYHLRGLRLWLLPQRRQQAQCVTYTDILPDTTDTVPNLVTKVNRIIQQNQLSGQILTIQTVSVPISNGNVDTEITRWTESVNDDSPYAFCLRVFHDKSTADNGSSVGIRDFIPCLTEEGYESFDQLSVRANTWLKDQSDIMIVNMQSVMVQKDAGPHEETGRACFYSIPGIENLHTLEFLRILRLCYMKPTADIAPELPVVYPFTYELFSPELVPPREGRGRNRMERMRETFLRVNSYLKSSGAEIISVETVMNPMQLYLEDVSQLSPDEIQFLFTIRLFLTDQLAEPDELLQTLSLRTSSVGSRQRKEPSPADRPGPIFLKSVVNKNYKSRWIVVAITVFTCMTIIVVISVIYSNP